MFSNLSDYLERFTTIAKEDAVAFKKSVNFHSNSRGSENNSDLAELFESCPLLEALWTVFPTLYLISAGSSGVPLVFHIEDLIVRPDIILKAIGSQWL